MMNYQTKITLPLGGGQIIREAMEKLIADSIDLGALAWVADYEAVLSSLDEDEMRFPCSPDLVRIHRALYDAACPMTKPACGSVVKRHTSSAKRCSEGTSSAPMRTLAAANLSKLLLSIIPGADSGVAITGEGAPGKGSSITSVRRRRVNLCEESRRGLEALGYSSGQDGVQSILSLPEPPMFSTMKPARRSEGIETMKVALSAGMLSALLTFSEGRRSTSATIRDLIRAHVASMQQPPHYPAR